MNTHHLAASAFALGARQARGGEAWDPRLPAVTFAAVELDDADRVILQIICEEGFTWSNQQTAIGRPIRPSYSALQALEDHPHLAKALPMPVQLDLGLPELSPPRPARLRTQTAASTPCRPPSTSSAWSGSRPLPAQTAHTHLAGAIAPLAPINERSAHHAR
jgi:hypothetical protein